MVRTSTLINNARKSLKEKPKERKRLFLSTGSTLLNLALSGKLNTGFETGHYYLLVGDSSSGKAQPMYSKILTPKGWVRMDDIKVGDDVIDPDGGIGRVTGVYPQGEKDVYQLTLSNRSSTHCCAEHLWLLENTNDRARGTTRIKNLTQIQESLMKGESLNVPTPLPCEFSNTPNLLIPPYLLGTLIGNGFLGDRCVYFSSVESHIIEKMKLLVPSGHNIAHRDRGCYAICYRKGSKNELLERLRKLKLAGTRSETKFIPKDYLTASIKDRIELLQGLMDTDGYVDQTGYLEYSTASFKLAEGVMELVRSLGGTASYTIKREPKYVHKGELRVGQPSYRISISLPDPRSAFTLPRKRDRVVDRKRRSTHKIKTVEHVGKKECQCIAVNTKRNLYITDDYIVTHNTFFTMTALAEASIDKRFDDYRLIYDDVERGVKMDTARYFGKKAAARIEFRHPTTVEEFYADLDSLIAEGRPFIRILDSMDALSTADDKKQFRKRAKATETGEKTSGSYGTAKAKRNSSDLRVVVNSLPETQSILIFICQTRDNIGFGAKFQPKTRSGGKALRFYATNEMWTSAKRIHKTRANGKKEKIGIVSKVEVKKNRIQGREPTICVRMLDAHGIDDTGSLVEFLIEEGHWKENKKVITAPDMNLVGKREKLIEQIQEENRENELRMIVGEVWEKIEEECRVNRKRRYE